MADNIIPPDLRRPPLHLSRLPRLHPQQRLRRRFRLFPAVTTAKYYASTYRTALCDRKLTEQFCQKWLGGAGFVAYYLWKELKPGVDALSPDNKLVFAIGPASGLLLPGAARNCIGAKSPLTGGIAKCECGGYWGAELKRAGFDGIIVEGKAEKPVYLWVHDGEVSIRDAANLWVKTHSKPKKRSATNWAMRKSIWR